MKRIFFALLAAVCTVLSLTAQSRQLTIVHTSDTHSCVEPVSTNFSDTTQADKGGFIRRAALVGQMRVSHPDDLLLLDCGDFSQGSAYYNLYQGEVEVSLMNLMHYDACTVGNHEFDFGLDNLARLVRMASFPFVCTNYDFTGTSCDGLVKPYVVLQRNGIRIGILAVCPNPDGLITKQNYEGVRFIQPAKAAQPVIDHLRNEEHCDLVVCLSHLGWGETPGMDVDFIRNTSGIDVLLGGHTHTYFDDMKMVPDRNGHQVIVDHEGKNGRFLGVIELDLDD